LFFVVELLTVGTEQEENGWPSLGRGVCLREAILPSKRHEETLVSEFTAGEVQWIVLLGGCPRIGIVARKWRSEAKLV
jgi:hypothetical protein